MSTIDFHSQFDQYTTVLNSFAYSLTKNVEDARDLYQETAFRAMKNRDKFAVGTNFKAWLMTIMKNIFINDYRKKVKSNVFSDGTGSEYYINLPSVQTANSAETSILVKELQVLIDLLEDEFKVPFVMYYYGHKYQDIADHMGLPLGTIKSRIFFARKELKAKIEKLYGVKRLWV